jgi:hypothetical protein
MFSWSVCLLHLLTGDPLDDDPRPLDLFRLLYPVYIDPLITARQPSLQMWRDEVER